MDLSDAARDDAAIPSVFDDLFETRETPDQPVRLGWRRRRPSRLRSPESESRPEQRSLFLDILDWMLVPLLLLWPLSLGITFVIARSLADAPFDRALVDRIQVVAQQIRAGNSNLMLPSPGMLGEGAPDDAEGAPRRLYVQVLASDGAVVAGDPALPRPSLYDFPTTGTIKLRNEQHEGEDLRIGYVHVELAPDGNEGSMLVQIGESIERRNRLANEIIKGVIFPQFVVLPLALVLVWFGLTRGLTPLKHLQRRIRERNPDDSSPIDPRGAPEEVAPLIDAFNELLARQMQTVRAQKRFIADAAHQIKTPLAGLQMQAELALRERDPAEIRRSLQQLVRSSERAARMVSQLLAMARAEHMRDALVFEPLDLAPLLRDIVSDWVPMALSRGIDLGLDEGAATGDLDEALEALSPWAPVSSDTAPPGPPRTWVDGHPVLLRECFNNLVDNALRYTPRGGSVTVRLQPAEADHGPVVSVIDTGPGIPESERELVFERFYRVLGTQVDGSGLGLAIVREIAQQHGAELALDANPALAAGGTAFHLKFPATPFPP